jgi:LacI family transcriptional regulator
MSEEGTKSSGLLARPGVREVARRAGVSPATVSRVLNGLPNVTPETRAKIQRTLDEMNYVRHGAARALSLHRSQTIGLLVPVLGTAVFAEAAQAIQERLQRRGYSLLTAGTAYSPQQELEAARTMIEHGVDGLIMVGSNHLPQLVELVQQWGIPAVQTFVYETESVFPSVGFDNYQPAYELTRHLVDLGHTEFAVMYSHVRNNDRIKARLDGILQCLADRGLRPGPERLVEVGYTIAEGRAGLRLLHERKKRFTALACTGHVIAVGALIEAGHRGIAVPRDLSITGFHDLELASHMEPPLTTVHVPIVEMSNTAVDLLLAELAGEAAPAVRNLPTSIVMRKSVGPPPRPTKTR